jgi:hypothetical protein
MLTYAGIRIEALDAYGDVIPGAEVTIYLALSPPENEVPNYYSHAHACCMLTYAYADVC